MKDDCKDGTFSLSKDGLLCVKNYSRKATTCIYLGRKCAIKLLYELEDHVEKERY